MRRKLTTMCVAVIALVGLCASPAHAAQIAGPYSWWGGMPNGASGFYNLDSSFRFTQDPDRSKNPAWFASYQFGPTDGPGGYIGLQVDNNYEWTDIPTNGKRAVFSWWGDATATCSSLPGAKCNGDADGNSGVSTMIPYDWKPGREYKMRVWAVGDTATHRSWAGWVVDMSTGTETQISVIHVPKSYGWLGDAGVNWLEWYGGTRPSCADFPLFSVAFKRPTANGGAIRANYPPSNQISNLGDCPARISNRSDPWILQEAGR